MSKRLILKIVQEIIHTSLIFGFHFEPLKEQLIGLELQNAIDLFFRCSYFEILEVLQHYLVVGNVIYFALVSKEAQYILAFLEGVVFLDEDQGGSGGFELLGQGLVEDGLYLLQMEQNVQVY